MDESIPDTDGNCPRGSLLQDVGSKKSTSWDAGNMTLLFHAAANARDIKTVRLLIQAGARPNTSVLRTKDGVNTKEESFLTALFRHMWHNPGRARSPTLAQAEDIIIMLLRYGARLDSINGELSALEYACGVPAVGVKYQLLRFLLLHSSAENVSYKHLQEVIADFHRRHIRTKWICKDLSDYSFSIVCKLAEFRDECYFDVHDDE